MCGACLESFVVKRDGDGGFDFELLSCLFFLFMIHNVPKQLREVVNKKKTVFLTTSLSDW